METGQLLSALQVIIGVSLAVYNLMGGDLLFGLAWVFVALVGMAFLTQEYQGPARV